MWAYARTVIYASACVLCTTQVRGVICARYTCTSAKRSVRGSVCTCVRECVCGRASGNERYEGRAGKESDKGRGYVEEVEEEYRDRGTKGQGKD